MNEAAVNDPHATVAPTTTPSAPPRAVKDVPILDGYEIGAELGQGGMGVVYRAWQHTPLIRREVALKLIRGAGGADPNEVERLIREANTLAGFHHPNIVTIYAAEWRDGCPPFLAMELMEGGSLARKLAGKPQLAEQAAEWVETLARAMHAVHQRGILHCDLKPANVLLDAHGTLKIGDFGLARRLEDNPHSRSLGAIKGTPSYMPPEQASGMCRHLQPSADVYALGAILYEMLTGRPPFAGVDSWDTLRLVLSAEVVPPSRLTPVPYDLETICLKCLQKAPRDRYASAKALADDLRRFRQHEPIHGTRPGPLKRLRLWCRRKPVAAVAVGLTSAAVLSVGLLSAFYNVELFAANQRTQHELERSEDLSERRRQALRLSACLAMDHCLSLVRQRGFDGQPSEVSLQHGLLWLGRALEIAGKAEDADLQAAVRRQLAFWHQLPKPSALPSRHKGPVWAIAISPDGRSFLTGSELPGDEINKQRPRGIAQLWDMASGRPIGSALLHDGPVGAVAFRPDGKRIATGSADGTAKLWDAATGKLLVTLRHRAPVHLVTFSPDGRLLATAGIEGPAQLWRCEDGEEVGTLAGHHGPIRCVAFRPNGRTLVTGSLDRTVRFWETGSGQPIGEPLNQDGPVVAGAFHPDGRTLLIRSAAPKEQPGQPEQASKGQARLWGVDTRTDLGSLFEPYFPSLLAMKPPQVGYPPALVAFSPNAPLVLTDNEERLGEAQLWDLYTRRPLGLPLRPGDGQPGGGEPAAIWSATFSPDGRTIVLANGDPVPWTVKVPAAVEGDMGRIRLWIQVLTHLELDDNGVERPLDEPTWEQRRRRLEEMGGPPTAGPV